MLCPGDSVCARLSRWRVELGCVGTRQDGAESRTSVAVGCGRPQKNPRPPHPTWPRALASYPNLYTTTSFACWWRAKRAIFVFGNYPSSAASIGLKSSLVKPHRSRNRIDLWRLRPLHCETPEDRRPRRQTSNSCDADKVTLRNFARRRMSLARQVDKWSTALTQSADEQSRQKLFQKRVDFWQDERN